MICGCVDFGEITAAKNRILRMACALELQGVRCLVVGYSKDNIGRGLIEYNGNEINVHYLSNSKTNPSWIMYSKLLKYASVCARSYREELAGIIANNSIEFVVGYTYLASVSSEILAAAKTARIPVVFDMVERFSLGGHNFLNGMYFQQNLFLLRDAKKADGLICISGGWLDWCNSNGIASAFIPSFYLEKNKNHDVPSRSDACSNGDDEKIVVFMGRINSREKFWTILRSIRLCRRSNVKVKIFLVGVHDRGLRAKLVKLYSKLWLDDSLVFLGVVDDFVKNSYLSASDFFILLRDENKESKYSFPTRLPEYLEYNKPIVLSRIKEFTGILNEERGVRFVDNSPCDISAAIVDLIRSNEEVDHSILLNKFSVKELGCRLNSFIEKVVRNKR